VPYRVRNYIIDAQVRLGFQKGEPLPLLPSELVKKLADALGAQIPLGLMVGACQPGIA